MQLGSLPRIKLAYLPTPLEEAPRLTECLGGPRIWIKRDDLTGLAMGGNKARKLEFQMGQARARDADVIITVGAPQSNHARMTAAAAKRLGMDAVVVLGGEAPEFFQGNLLLDRIFGADVRILQTDDDYILSATIEDIARQLKQQGRRPFVIPRGASNAYGAAAYLEAAIEMLSQANAMGIRVDAIVHASTSGGTQSGLYAGTRLTESGVQVIGISAGPKKEVVVKRVLGIVTDLAELLDLQWRPHPDDIIVYDDFVGEKYAVPTPEGLEAIRVLARTEGVLLDPVYSGKGMAGLIGLIASGRFTPDQNVVFWHTGGQPALFAFAGVMQEG